MTAAPTSYAGSPTPSASTPPTPNPSRKELTLNPIALLVISLLIAVVAHEAAHGVVLHKLGFPLQEAGFGIPIGPHLRIKKNRRVPFDLTVSPLPVMAYVMPRPEDADRLAALPYRDKAWYLNVGIITNVLLAFGFATATALVDGKWLPAAITAAIGGAIWLARRPAAAYVLPALSVPVLAYIVWSLATFPYSLGNTGLGFASLAHAVPAGLDMAGSLYVIATINIAIAAINASPIFGDNGKVVREVLARWTTPKIAGWYEISASIAVLGLFAAAIVSDLIALALKILQGT